jgi:hypothetical protein
VRGIDNPGFTSRILEVLPGLVSTIDDTAISGPSARQHLRGPLLAATSITGLFGNHR